MPLRQKAYQPCGDLWIDFPGHKAADSYRRWLDLDTAPAVTEYEAGDVTLPPRSLRLVSRTAPICVRVTADKPGKLDCARAPDQPAQGFADHGGRRATRSSCTARSKRTASASRAAPGLRPKAARWPRKQDALRSHRRGRARHPARRRDQFQELPRHLRRPGRTLRGAAAKCGRQIVGAAAAGAPRRSPGAVPPRRTRPRPHGRGRQSRPTSASVSSPTATIPHLAALVFQYGRYLLIGSSRAGGQPANLQGIWNDQLKPPWDSKYTCNINTEMNYWPAEPANLAECAEPLFDALGRTGGIRPRDRARSTTARAAGCCTTTSTSGAAPPRSTPPTTASGSPAARGCAMHLWEHYLFTGTRSSSHERAYPLMKEAALFFADLPGRGPADRHGSSAARPTRPSRAASSWARRWTTRSSARLFSACVEAAARARHRRGIRRRTRRTGAAHRAEPGRPARPAAGMARRQGRPEEQAPPRLASVGRLSRRRHHLARQRTSSRPPASR